MPTRPRHQKRYNARKRLRPPEDKDNKDILNKFVTFAQQFNSARRGLPAGANVLSASGLKDPDVEDGNNFVDIPVITVLPMKHPANGIDYEYNFRDGDPDGSHIHRSFYEHEVVNPLDDTSKIMALRHSLLNLRIRNSRPGTFAHYGIMHGDPPPRTESPIPGGQRRHWRSHVIRYYQKNDKESGNWVDTEKIGSMRFRDYAGRGQLWKFKLYNYGYKEPIPDDTDAEGPDPFKPSIGFIDVNLPFAETERGISTSNLLDPFQSIVNIHWEQDFGRFIATDPFGRIYSSVDGFNWSIQQSKFGRGISQVAYGNGLWVITGMSYLDEVDSYEGAISSRDAFGWSDEYMEEFPPMHNVYGFNYSTEDNKFHISRFPVEEDITIDNPNDPEKFGGVASSISGPYAWITGGRVRGKPNPVYVGLGYDDNDISVLYATEDMGETWVPVTQTEYPGWDFDGIMFEEPSQLGIGATDADCSPRFPGQADGGYNFYPWTIPAGTFSIDAGFAYPGKYYNGLTGGDAFFAIWMPDLTHDSEYMETYRDAAMAHMAQTGFPSDPNDMVTSWGGWYRFPSETPCGGNWQHAPPDWEWDWKPPEKYVNNFIQAVADAVADYPSSNWVPYGINGYIWQKFV